LPQIGYTIGVVDSLLGPPNRHVGQVKFSGFGFAPGTK